MAKNHYSDEEREAIYELYAKQQTIAHDPYLLFEVNKVYRVLNKKFTPKRTAMVKTHDSIDDTASEKKNKWEATH